MMIPTFISSRGDAMKVFQVSKRDKLKEALIKLIVGSTALARGARRRRIAWGEREALRAEPQVGDRY
jgi:hypothetical protein